MIMKEQLSKLSKQELIEVVMNMEKALEHEKELYHIRYNELKQTYENLFYGLYNRIIMDNGIKINKDERHPVVCVEDKYGIREINGISPLYKA